MTDDVDTPQTTPGPDLVVSVVIPAHQAAAYLAECLESITTQTQPPHEVVVVDDGSTDDTVAIATRAGQDCGPTPVVRVISTPHLGAASARNTGVAAAVGNVVAFCDADDVWLPHKLEAQLALIDDPADPIAVFCGATEFLSPDINPDDYTGRTPTPVIPEARFTSTLVATTAALGAVGPFAGGVGAADWLPWCVALADTIDDIRFADTIGTRRRLHLANSSAGRHHDRTQWLAALRRHANNQPPTDMPDAGLPTVSVVIPVHNRAHLLAEAVDSVLAQTGVALEVVVVNDGSTDASGSVADQLAATDHRVRAIHQDNAGPAAARNAGAALTTGRYLTFVDSDDLIPPGRLAEQVAAIDRVGPDAVVLGEEEISVADGVTPPPSIAVRLTAPKPHWNTMTLMVTRELFDRVGGFDESFLLGEDTELLYRLKRQGAIVARFEQVWTHRRIFGDNLIYDDEALRRAGVRALRANLADGGA